MLAGLGLDGFGGGDHEQHHVDASGSGEHVAHEALVAGDIDEAEADVVGELKVREAEVDGDAAALLFGEAVGVGSGEGFYQRRLAVIDVTGSADDDVSHLWARMPANAHFSCRASTRAGTTSKRSPTIP